MDKSVVDDVLKRRLVGALVLLGASFGLASLLPEPDSTPEPPGVVRYDLRTGETIGATEMPAPAGTRPTLKVDDSLGEPTGWFVQVASFGNQGNARTALQQLYGRGLPAIIQSVTVGSSLMYRVRVGPYEDEAQAREALAAIGSEYGSAKLVPPDPAAPEPASN